MKRLFRIQYVSDLHLEFYDKLAFPTVVRPNAKFLALAGDIVPPTHKLAYSFFDYVSTNWEHVFYVAGNHEFYQTHVSKWKYKRPATFFETEQTIQQLLKKFPNIHYLNYDDPCFHIAEYNTTMLGSTLWTHIPKNKMYEASGINDYSYISLDGVNPITPEYTSELHQSTVEKFHDLIDYWRSQRANIVVLTHHMPSYDLISDKYVADPLTVCFASNCHGLLRPSVRAWIYGHTHNVAVGNIQGVHTVINARGYPKQYIPGFCNHAFLEFIVSDEDPVTDTELQLSTCKNPVFAKADEN